MTRAKFGSVAGFTQSAADYAATMAPALAPVAAEVVRRAALRPNETVLDVGTGPGTAARLAIGEGRRVIGLDASAGMLEIAAREAPGVELVEADFTQIPLEDGSVDVVLAVHALLFAGDRVAALHEWLRVTAPGGRLSLSVPGPGNVVPSAVFGAVYDHHGVKWSADDYPNPSAVEGWANEAGWADVASDADPTAAIPLADDIAFRTWLRFGQTTSDWSPERVEAFADELMALSPKDADGSFRIPFGSIHLTARSAA